MSDSNGNGEQIEGQDKSTVDGGSGGPCVRERGRADTKLLERALRERWEIPEKYRQPIINRQVRIAIDAECSPRESTSAARCLVSMDAQNLAAALKAVDKIVPDQHEITHGVDVRAIATELESDPDYVEFVNQRACESDTDAGAICQIGNNGHERAVGNGSSHARSEPGTNGDRNGHE